MLFIFEEISDGMCEIFETVMILNKIKVVRGWSQRIRIGYGPPQSQRPDHIFFQIR